MSAPDTTIGSELDQILVKYLYFPARNNEVVDFLKAKSAITNLIAQEANKARIDELKMFQDLYKNELKFTHRDESELRSYTQHRIAQLTADKEQSKTNDGEPND